MTLKNIGQAIIFHMVSSNDRTDTGCDGCKINFNASFNPSKWTDSCTLPQDKQIFAKCQECSLSESNVLSSEINIAPNLVTQGR
mgnify:CR=1 FL=1|jgi:hypothetical protein